MTEDVTTNIAARDAHLIQRCLEGDADSWFQLVDKYQNLIYSVPMRWGFSPDEATDIFQSVVAQVLSELRHLREPRALPAWLIQTTWRQCNQWQKLRRRTDQLTDDDHAAFQQAVEPPESLIYAARREQILLQVVTQSSPRCRRLIQMLFFEQPALPYEEIADQLGIATGSVGFIRRRCLDRLKASLEEAGFR